MKATATKPGFGLSVSKEYLAFSAGHFITYPGFRERLHGHNYSVSVAVRGKLGANGYVLDFGLVKKVAKRLCDELDERTLVPSKSESLSVEEREEAVDLTCEDGSHFVFPRGDVVLLPIAHTSAEELARYLCLRLAEQLRSETMIALESVEVAVAEAPGQAASFCHSFE